MQIQTQSASTPQVVAPDNPAPQAQQPPPPPVVLIDLNVISPQPLQVQLPPTPVSTTNPTASVPVSRPLPTLTTSAPSSSNNAEAGPSRLAVPANVPIVYTAIKRKPRTQKPKGPHRCIKCEETHPLVTFTVQKGKRKPDPVCESCTNPMAAAALRQASDNEVEKILKKQQLVAENAMREQLWPIDLRSPTNSAFPTPNGNGNGNGSAPPPSQPLAPSSGPQRTIHSNMAKQASPYPPPSSLSRPGYPQPDPRAQYNPYPPTNPHAPQPPPGKTAYVFTPGEVNILAGAFRINPRPNEQQVLELARQIRAPVKEIDGMFHQWRNTPGGTSSAAPAHPPANGSHAAHPKKIDYTHKIPAHLHTDLRTLFNEKPAGYVWRGNETREIAGRLGIAHRWNDLGGLLNQWMEEGARAAEHGGVNGGSGPSVNGHGQQNGQEGSRNALGPDPALQYPQRPSGPHGGGGGQTIMGNDQANRFIAPMGPPQGMPNWGQGNTATAPANGISWEDRYTVAKDEMVLPSLFYMREPMRSQEWIRNTFVEADKRYSMLQSEIMKEYNDLFRGSEVETPIPKDLFRYLRKIHPTAVLAQSDDELYRVWGIGRVAETNGRFQRLLPLYQGGNFHKHGHREPVQFKVQTSTAVRMPVDGQVQAGPRLAIPRNRDAVTLQGNPDDDQVKIVQAPVKRELTEKQQLEADWREEWSMFKPKKGKNKIRLSPATVKNGILVTVPFQISKKRRHPAPPQPPVQPPAKSPSPPPPAIADAAPAAPAEATDSKDDIKPL